MQGRDIQILAVRLLRKEDMQQLHQELAEDHEDKQDHNMQELLERHEEERHLQGQGFACRVKAWMISNFVQGICTLASLFLASNALMRNSMFGGVQRF
jgi:hypothetical protein